MTTNLHDKMLAAIDAYFSASNEIEAHIAEEQLLDVRAAINKHKLAAESLSEGLRLDDWDKIGCVNHDCDQCKAQQESLTEEENSKLFDLLIEEMLAHSYQGSHDSAEKVANEIRRMYKAALREALAEQPAQQEPIGRVIASVRHLHSISVELLPEVTVPPVDSMIYTTPQAQPAREWVGLADEDIEQGYETTGHYQTLRPQDRFAVFALARAIEAKLKEKNT